MKISLNRSLRCNRFWLGLNLALSFAIGTESTLWPQNSFASESFKLPCTENPAPSSILKGCTQLKAQVRTGVLGPEGEVTLMRENIRLGKSPDGFSQIKTTPVCDPAKSTDMDKDASTCGSWVTFVRDGMRIKSKMQSDADTQREYNHLGGSMLAMIDHYSAVVLEEMNSGGIQISPGCEGAAVKIKEKITDQSQSLTGHENADDIINCKKIETEVINDKVTDVGSHRISARLLCAAQSQIEAAASHLVSCEIMRRSEVAYQQLLSNTSPNMEDFVTALSKKVEKTCRDSCRTVRCARKCANSHYAPEFLKLYREKMKQSFPQAKISAFTPNRLRNVIQPVLAGANPISSLVFFSFMLSGLLSSILSGCSRGSAAAACAQANRPPCSASQIDAGGCCIQDPNTSGDGSGSATALAQAAGAIIQADDLFSKSKKLVSNTSGSPLDGFALAGAKATAGETLLAPSAQSQNGSANTGAGGSGGPVGGAGSMDGNGSAGGAGGPAFAGAKGTQDSVQTAVNSEFTEGGGKAKGGGGVELLGGDSGRSYGNSAGGAAGENMQFGQDPAGAGAAMLEFEDPADYFTRINIEESLFKRIETRYATKNRGWLIQDNKR